jgi:hypothetical protein
LRNFIIDSVTLLGYKVGTLKKCEGRAMDQDDDPPQDARTTAEALLRDPSLTVSEIARRLGVSRQRIQQWNRRSAVRAPSVRRRSLAAWPPERRTATIRVLAVADPGDVTEALGYAQHSAPALLTALGLGRPPNRPGGRAPHPAEATTHPRRLRALLRAHIGRQIAAFDAALGDPRTGTDSAKVLRDLGGLKRLLDDLGPGDAADADDTRGEGEARDAPTRPGHEAALDLDGIRAEIARRYDRFVGGGAIG